MNEGKGGDGGLETSWSRVPILQEPILLLCVLVILNCLVSALRTLQPVAQMIQQWE